MNFAKKSLGQNFLIDKNIVKKIVNLENLKGKDIIEIGPGKGALTEEILNSNPKSIKLIEKDSNLFNLLKSRFKNQKTITIFNSDILKFKIDKILTKNTVIIGNLPYNISSQILVKILKIKWPPKFRSLIFMFQKELGEKILGKFGSKNYGRLSILSNYRLSIKSKFLVSKNCFFPKPKVTSIVINFVPKSSNIIKIKDLSNLEKVTNILFSNKRKMINKNLKKLINAKDVKSLKDLSLDSRPAELRPEIFYKIAKIYEMK